MNLNHACVYQRRGSTADGDRGGVCLLADVLLDLLANYQVGDEEPDDADDCVGRREELLVVGGSR